MIPAPRNRGVFGVPYSTCVAAFQGEKQVARQQGGVGEFRVLGTKQNGR